MKKYESKIQSGLFFWAQANDELPGPKTFGVVAQVEGFPASEAWDDWFGRFSDADDMARLLASGEEF